MVKTGISDYIAIRVGAHASKRAELGEAELGLFGRKPDHPLADIKSAQTLLEGLPKQDALKYLPELTGLIESLRELSDMRVDQQFEVLRLLDETARPFERKLAREYFSTATLSTFQENRLWAALEGFYSELELAYAFILQRYRNGDKGASSIKPVLALLAGRGIAAIAGKLKYGAARYARIAPELWQHLAACYAQAEAQQCVDERVSLYAGIGNTTVRCEFASTLMWYACSANNLKRIQLHLAERISANLSKYFTVSADNEQGVLYTLDLHQPAAPARASADTAVREGLRFVGITDVKTPMDGLFKTLAKNVVPDELNLGGTYDAELVRDVLQHLADSWVAAPRTRRNARHNINARLQVLNGFSNIVEQSDLGLSFGDTTSVVWQVADMSMGGFRCVLPAAQVNGLAIGALLGLKPEKIDTWGVGVVRRLGRDAENNLQVGVEILTNQMAGVALREQQADSERPALWLNQAASDAGEARLLVGPDAFSGSRSLHMRMGDKNYLLMPLELVEKGEDYDLVRYRKIEEDLSADESY